MLVMIVSHIIINADVLSEDFVFAVRAYVS